MHPTLKAIQKNDEVIIKGPCFVTHKEYSVTVSLKSFLAWEISDHIQDAMPDLSAGDREFLISGTSPEGWKELFSNDEDL